MYFLNRIRIITVCVFAALMLGVLIFYVATFFKWNESPAFLVQLNSILETIYWLPIVIALLFGIIVSIYKRRIVSWTTGGWGSLWIQKLVAWGFMVSFVIVVATMVTQEFVTVRSQGSRIEAFIHADGKWEAVSDSKLEKIIQGDARRQLSWILFSLLLWMGIVGGSAKTRSSKYVIPD